MSGKPSTANPAKAAAVRMAVVAVAMLAAIVAAPPAVRAGAPVHETFEITSVDCASTGEFGTVHLNISHSETRAALPGADISVWDAGKIPMIDPPSLIGFEEEVVRNGTTLTGRVALRKPGSGEPGEGVAANSNDTGDIVGWANYEVTYRVSGPSTEERVQGPIVEHHQRYNAHFRTDKTRTPLTATGIVTLPGFGDIHLDDCNGRNVIEDIFITSPSTLVGSGRYPLGFECSAHGPAGIAYIVMVGGDLTVVVFRTGDEQPVAIGNVFADARRTTLTAEAAMFDYESGDDRGTALLEASLRTVGRQTLRFRDLAGTDTVKVERLRVTGSLSFEDAEFQLDACDGFRSRQHTVNHQARQS